MEKVSLVLLLCCFGAYAKNSVILRQPYRADNTKADEKIAVRMLIEKEETGDVIEIMDNLEEKGISRNKLLYVRSASALESRVLLPGIRTWVNDKIKTEYSMNIKTAFLLLGKVGKLLQVSYAGCKGYDCQVSVAKVHSQYQDLIYASARVGSKFVSNAIRALKYHYYANKRVDKDDLEKAFKWITKCSLIADKMVEDSKMMVAKSDNLRNLTEVAFIDTIKDDVKNKKQRDALKAKLSNVTANVDEINAMLEEETKNEKEANKEIQAAIKDAKEWEEKHKTEAGKKLKENEICTPMDNGISVMGISIGWKSKSCYMKLDPEAVKQQKGILEGYEKQIQTARNRQLEVLKIKRRIQERTADLYGRLAAFLEETKHKKFVGKELERAQASLQIAIRVLAMVKTIFLNSLQFWIKVTENAKELGSNGDIKLVLQDLELDEIDAFTELLGESAFSWMALGKVSNDAAVAMRAVQADVTAQFIDLPSHAQAKILIDASGPIIDETAALIKSLHSDVSKTNKEIEDAEKAVKKEKEFEEQSW